MAIFLLVYLRYDIMFYRFLFQDHHSERAVYMPQRPVSPGPGRDGDPAGARAAYIDALVAECRESTAEEAAFAARAARLGLPGGTPIGEGRRGPGQPGSAVRRLGEFASRAA